MRWDWMLLRKIADVADLETEPLPGEPVIEIGGTQRLLIEQHQGVLQYSQENIVVKVHFGTVHVIGKDLEIEHMTRDRLLIGGTLTGVELIRREVG